MINLPVGMLTFLIFKMDYDFIINGLQPDQSFNGLSYEEFTKKIKESFDHFKSMGDDRLSYVIGKTANNDNMVIGFESPSTQELFPFVFEIDGEIILATHHAEQFIKEKNSRSNFSL